MIVNDSFLCAIMLSSKNLQTRFFVKTQCNQVKFKVLPDLLFKDMMIKEKIKAGIKKTWGILKDKTNITIYVIVTVVLSSEVWLSYLLAVITGNKWFWAVGSACWAFWLAPFTPFIPLCIAITFTVRKIYDKIKNKSIDKKG